MKTFNELTEKQQQKAIDYFLKIDLEAIMDGWLKFNDDLNGDDLQQRIDDAWKKAENMRTPWFWGDYIMETCSEELTAMAQAAAEDSIYPEQHERMEEGIA